MISVKLLAVIIAGSSLLFAQAATPDSQAQPETKAQSVAENSSVMIHGKVLSIDTMLNKMIVKDKKTKDTLFVSSTATIVSGDKVIALKELKKGANVEITWELIADRKTVSKILEKVTGGSEKANY